MTRRNLEIPKTAVRSTHGSDLADRRNRSAWATPMHVDRSEQGVRTPWRSQ
jgi:hypothetical protein